MHFFYITNINEKIYDASMERNDIRLLEPDTWLNYLDCNSCIYPRLAYHWKQTHKERSDDKNDGDKDFYLFFRIDVHKLNGWLISTYFALAVLIGEIGSQACFVNQGDDTEIISHLPHFIINILIAIIFVVYIIWRFYCLIRKK